MPYDIRVRTFREGLKKLIYSKPYVLILLLTALCGYGFRIVWPVIGIDDTLYDDYFNGGLAPYMGRWVLFLLGRVLKFTDFAPFATEFISVIVFMAAVTVFAVLFLRIFWEDIPFFGYILFSCIFLSSPIHSEVFSYFLHNGTALGYLLTGISLNLLMDSYVHMETNTKPAPYGRLICIAFLVTLSTGLYESFMIVWILGVFLSAFSLKLYGRRSFRFVFCGGLTAAASVIFRSLCIRLVLILFNITTDKETARLRSMKELAGWLASKDALSDFVMALKRAYVMYFAFMYAYLPVAVFVFAAFILFFVSIVFLVKKKNVWVLLLFIISSLSCFLLIPIEGKVTLYRSAQFLPLYCGFGALMLFYCISKIKIARIISATAAAILLFNQCMMLNRYFYIEYMKYEEAINVIERIDYELKSSFDISKPVVFTGLYEVPESLISDAYVEIGSKTFYRIKRLTDIIDPTLLEKFYKKNGVEVAQHPALSVIEWGRYAFGDSTELIKFFRMHGMEINYIKGIDYETMYGIEMDTADMPRFPQEGSVRDFGDYIVVHF